MNTIFLPTISRVLEHVRIVTEAVEQITTHTFNRWPTRGASALEDQQRTHTKTLSGHGTNNIKKKKKTQITTYVQGTRSWCLGSGHALLRYRCRPMLGIFSPMDCRRPEINADDEPIVVHSIIACRLKSMDDGGRGQFSGLHLAETTWIIKTRKIFGNFFRNSSYYRTMATFAGDEG